MQSLVGGDRKSQRKQVRGEREQQHRKEPLSILFYVVPRSLTQPTVLMEAHGEVAGEAEFLCLL